MQRSPPSARIHTEKTAMRKHNLNTQFPIEETDRHVTTGSRFPKCLLLLGTSVCNWDVELSMHKLFSALSLWNAPLMKGKQQGRCCYDQTPWSTLGNLLQAPEICGSGARSIGNSQNECQNDLAVQSCLKHFLSSRERDDDPSLTSPDTSETCSNRSKLAVGFDRAAWNRIMSICCVTSVALLI